MNDWLNTPCRALDESARDAAIARQAQLTKPPGALGELENLAIRLAAQQGQEQPWIDHIQITVFAADHGIAEEGVSAFPQAVTLEMVKNFNNGGAAICVLADALGAKLEVVNLGTVLQTDAPLANVIDAPIAAGTANFARGDAMTEAQLAAALDAGKAAVQRAVDSDVELFIGGDMGIANTSAATAVACALLGLPARDLTGPGTGLDADGVNAKAKVIDAALALHGREHTPLETLRRMGGFEIAALAGAYLHCAQQGVPALVDGFIASAAALVAVRHNPDVTNWLHYSHASAEPGHAAMMQALDAGPMLDLGMRLGEGSGAGVAAHLLRLACQLHAQMATFAEAEVSGKL
ncbi:MAG: nicotinate-nucleotide--dimethylbenzimidazole phosphoribosyltransferase [Pseudomonadota bacterium]